MAAVMMAESSALQDASAAPAGKQQASTKAGLALLLTAPVLMGFAFYVGLAMFGGALGNFSVSALGEMYEDSSLRALGWVLSAYLIASPIGVLVGGYIADRIRRHDWLAAGCFVGIAVLVSMVAAFDLSLLVIGVVFAFAGLLNGIVAPSRDMLIRSMTPPGQMGKVFGFVSTGFNVGGIVAPLMFGYILDNGAPALVFWVAAGLALLTVPTVLITGSKGRRAASARARPAVS